MYVLRLEGTVAPGRITDFEAFVDRFTELLKRQKGFQAGSLLNSMGYPAKYVGTQRWESREACLAFARSQDLKSFIQANSLEGIYTPLRLTEAAETVHFNRKEGPLGHLLLVDVTVDSTPGNAQAFEDRCKEFFALHQRVGKGAVLSALTRSLAGGGRYAIAWGHSTSQDFEATFAMPEVRQFMEAKPVSKYASTPIVGELFEVVRLVVLQPVP